MADQMLRGTRGRMWSARGRLLAAAVISTLSGALSVSHAATLTWDPGMGMTMPTGGTGNWDLTDPFWSTGAADQTWTNTTGTGALFAGIPGTVTLTQAITAGTLTFNTPGYILATGTNVLTLGTTLTVADSGGTTTVTGTGGISNAGGAVAFSVAAGDTLQFDAPYASTGSLTLTSNGTTNITNTFSVTAKSVFNGTGNVNLSGTEAFATASGDYAGIQGTTVTNSAGTATVNPGTGNSFYIGSTASATAGSTLDVTGGIFSVTSATRIFIGDSYNGSTSTLGDGTINVGGGVNAATFTTGTTTNGSNDVGGFGTGTINLLSNGTFATDRSFTAGSAGKGLVYFNGGTFMATGTAASLASSLSTYIRNGGGTINTQTFAITIASPIAHSNIGTDSATDGGLVTYGTGAATFSGILSFTGGLTLNAPGTLSGANTYTGLTTINAPIDISNSSGLGATGIGNNTIVNTGGSVRFRDHTFNTAEAITINGGGFVLYNDPGTSTYSGVITLDSSNTLQFQPETQASTTSVFSGGFAEGGTASSLVLLRNGAAGTNSNDVVDITGASTYGGSTTITDSLTGNAGIFSAELSGGDNRLPVGTTVTLGGAGGGGAAPGNAQLILGNATTGASNQTLAGIATSGTGTKNAIIGGNASVSTLTVTSAATDVYAGAIGSAAANGNNIALVMGGAGTLSLTGANPYTGGTTVNSGTLQVDSSTVATAALSGTSGVSLASGAALKLISTLAAGTNPNLIDDSASVSVVTGSLITLALNGNTETIGSFVVNGAPQPQGTYGFGTAPTGSEADEAFFTADSNGTFTVVPEPATLSILAMGGLGLLKRRRRSVSATI